MPQRSLQHDFLFLAIALEQGCIERGDIPAIFSETRASGDATIREHLIRRGAIRESLAAELDKLVAAQLTTSEYRRGTENVSNVNPPPETLVNAAQRTDDRGRIARRHEARDAPAPSDDTLRGSRYRVLRNHAEGGLGRVVVALDQELAREVALKEIKSAYAADRDSRDRFEQEALITGGLEHPGIVPVYGFGKNADGSPFYAMRFIRGDGFDEAIHALHGAVSGNRTISDDVASRKTDVYREPAKLFEFRKLLQRFVGVCDAIEYAHSRGVVHRDLKPANVMLGRYGETLVVDWGLAKAMTTEIVATVEGNSRLSEAPDSDQQLTAYGATVGTPAYMSPEQAAGEVARIGPASDVYCLGATLYHLLTGLPPILGKNVSDVLTKVRLGDVEPAHRRVVGVPKSLSAICRKAMALHPEDRYSGPRALADDLEHWLANEPIHAHRETFGERIARWTRRHRAWAQAAGTALAAIVAVLGVAIVLVNGQRKTAETQRARAETLADEKSDLLNVERDLRKKAEWQAANRMYEQSLNICAQGDTALGLLALQESLSESVRIGAADLERSMRMQLARWSHRVHRLEAVTPVDSQIRRMFLEPDGKTILAGLNSGHCVAYDPTTDEFTPRKYRHDDVVSSIAFTADGKTLATGGFDRTVRLWNVADESPLGEPLKHDSPVNAVAIDGHGKLLLSGCDDGRVIAWDLSTRAPRAWDLRHEKGIVAVWISADDLVATTVGWDGYVRFWDLQTGKSLGEPLAQEWPIISAARSEDGKFLITGGIDNVARLWDLANKRAIGVPMTHAGIIFNVGFSRDGKIAFTTSADHTVRIWNAANGKSLGPPLSHADAAPAVIFDAAGKTLFTAGNDRHLRTWRLAEDKLFDIASPGNPFPIGIGYSSDGQEIRTVTGGVEGLKIAIPGTYCRWSTKTGERLGQPLENFDWSTVAAIAPDGSQLVACDTPTTAKIWNLRTGRASDVVLEHQGEIKLLKYRPDGRIIMSAGDDHVVRFWNAETGRALQTTLPHGHRIAALDYRYDGRYVVTGCWDNHARVWDAETGKSAGPGFEHDALVTAVAYRPDGKAIASGTGTGSIRVWDATTGKLLGPAIQESTRITALAFSPDGNTLLSGGVNGSVTLWDLRNHERIGTEMLHEKTVLTACFSPDGRTALTAGNNLKFRVWETAPFTEFTSQVKNRCELDTNLRRSEDRSVRALTGNEWLELRKGRDEAPK